MTTRLVCAVVLAVGLAGCCGGKRDKVTEEVVQEEGSDERAGGARDPNAMASDGLPVVIPRARSARPELAEWNAVTKEIRVGGSTALRCKTRMLREWLKVKCAGNLPDGSQPFGLRISGTGCPTDTYTFASKTEFTDLLMPVLRGRRCQVDFFWTGDTSQRTLTVDWSVGKRPTISF